MSKNLPPTAWPNPKGEDSSHFIQRNENYQWETVRKIKTDCWRDGGVGKEGGEVWNIENDSVKIKYKQPSRDRCQLEVGKGAAALSVCGEDRHAVIAGVKGKVLRELSDATVAASC